MVRHGILTVTEGDTLQTVAGGADLCIHLVATADAVWKTKAGNDQGAQQPMRKAADATVTGVNLEPKAYRGAAWDQDRCCVASYNEVDDPAPVSLTRGIAPPRK